MTPMNFVTARSVPRAGFLASLILLVALVVRLAYVHYTRHFVLGIDEMAYNRLARSLAAGRGWAGGDSAYRPPGMPFFLAGVYAVVGAPVRSGDWTTVRVVLAVLSVVTVALVGAVARELAGVKVAIVALFLAALYLPLIVTGDSLMTEALFVPVSLAATLCALISRREVQRYGWIALAGALCGVTALTRGNGLVVALALAGMVYSATPHGWLRGLRAPALLLAVTALTVAPWTVRNALVQHAFIPVTDELPTTLAGTYNNTSARHHFIWTTGSQYGNYWRLRHDKMLAEDVRSQRLLAAVVAYIGRHPLDVPQAMFWNTVRLLDLEGRFISRRSARQDFGVGSGLADVSVYTFWVVGILAGLGLCLRSKFPVVPRAVWLVPIFIWLSEAPITTGTPRFRAPLDPWFIILAAVALCAVAEQLGSRAWVRASGWMAARTHNGDRIRGLE